MNSVQNNFDDFDNILKNGKIALLKFGNIIDALKIYTGKIKLNLPLVDKKKGNKLILFIIIP